MSDQNRREFSTLAAASMLMGAGVVPKQNSNQQESAEGPPICCFVKFIQSLSFDEMAEKLAKFGYQGIEATIRPKGMILPENAKVELPKLVKALDKQGLKITVMTTATSSAEDAVGKSVLETAADLGIKRYRPGYYRYDLNKPIVPQIDGFRTTANGLAALNEKLGMTAVYQNHAGAKYLGSTIWDLRMLLKDINPEHVGVAFDIRHATASAGVSWPILWDVIKDHVRTIYVKDFVWKGAKFENVALGKGVVSQKFFDMIVKEKLNLPISIHVEYLQKASLEENVAALETDLKTLREKLSRKVGK